MVKTVSMQKCPIPKINTFYDLIKCLRFIIVKITLVSNIYSFLKEEIFPIFIDLGTILIQIDKEVG